MQRDFLVLDNKDRKLCIVKILVTGTHTHNMYIWFYKAKAKGVYISYISVTSFVTKSDDDISLTMICEVYAQNTRPKSKVDT